MHFTRSILILTIFSLISPLVQAQAYDEPGFRFLKRIRGINLHDSKVQEILIDEKSNNVVISYRSKKIVYLSIYKLYSWDKLNDYRIDDRVELYNSYFEETGDYFYMNFDVYKKLYKKIDVHTGAVDTLKCSETPRGCYKINQAQYPLQVSTKDRYYLLKRDKVHPNDVLIYVDQQYFTTIHEQHEQEIDQSVSIVDFKEKLVQDARDLYGDIHKRKTPLPKPKEPVKKEEPKVETKTETAEKTPAASEEPSKASIILTQADIMLIMNSGELNKEGVKVTLENGVELDIIDPDVKDFSTVSEVKKGQLLKLDNILFEQGSFELNAKSHQDLDRLAEMMINNPKLRIQVNGHTNNIGIKNKEISEKRAKAVVDYLASKNIADGRLQYKGYGDTKPIASNETEEGKTINRRVEIVVLDL